MNNELCELAYGSYETCNACGVSDLTHTGWGCVCALLIDAGNCPGCMNIPTRCVCNRMQRQRANADEMEISSLDVTLADDLDDQGDQGDRDVALGDDAPSLFDSVDAGVAGYVPLRRVVHRYRTVYQPANEPVAYTPAWSSSAEPVAPYLGIPGQHGVPPLTTEERAGLWRGPASPRYH